MLVGEGQQMTVNSTHYHAPGSGPSYGYYGPHAPHGGPSHGHYNPHSPRGRQGGSHLTGHHNAFFYCIVTLDRSRGSAQAFPAPWPGDDRERHEEGGRSPAARPTVAPSHQRDSELVAGHMLVQNCCTCVWTACNSNLCLVACM